MFHCNGVQSKKSLLNQGGDKLALHFARLGWVWKCGQSKRPYFMNLYHLRPSRFDRSLSGGAHSHVRCCSSVSTARISFAGRKLLGGESESVRGPRRPPLPIVKDVSPLPDCPINQPPAGWGSFHVPVTTSDCLGCSTSRTSSSPQLIIALTRQLLSRQMQVWNWMREIMRYFQLRRMNLFASRSDV